MNVLETDNKESSSINEELISRTEIEGTPFTVIGIDNKYFGVMGQYRITEEYEDKEAVIAGLKEMNWNRIVQVILILKELNTDINQ